VAEAVDKPKIQHREMKTMSESDIHLFLELARESEFYALFYTYLFTGCRRSELLAIRWLNVDLLGCQLSITRSMQYEHGVKTFKEPKTKKSRRLIDLSPSNVAVLQEHREAQNKQRQALKLPVITDNDLVFSHWDGSPFSPDSITHAFHKIALRCGLNEIHTHSARHSHATLLHKQGVPVKVIIERLGHASIAITLDLYAHVTPGMQRDAAAKFDDIVLPKVKQEN